MSDMISTTELCDRYGNLYPGAITDILDDRGYLDQTLDPEINPIQDHVNVAGIAYPVKGRPNRDVDEEENIRNVLQMLGDTPEDAVLMYETNADNSAQIGELSVECLIRRDCRGAVLDGGARDLSFILNNDFPLFTRYSTPADAIPRWEIHDWGTDAIVGGVEVSPGDVVVGDVDGVVVVPKEIAEDVLHEAESLSTTEDSVRTAVQNGVQPLEAYDEFGEF